MGQLAAPTWLFVSSIIGWAESKPWIGEIWLIGSRARGDFEPNSDLDIVLKTTLAGKDAYAKFFFESDKWRDELTELLGVAVHICQGDAEYTTPEVERGLKADGTKVYPESKDKCFTTS